MAVFIADIERTSGNNFRDIAQNTPDLLQFTRVYYPLATYCDHANF